MTLLQWAQLVGVIVVAIVAVLLAAVYFVSRYRKAADAERERYITALEDRNRFLEQQNDDKDKEVQELKCEMRELRGQFKVLQDLVLLRCPQSEKDDVSGGCRWCSKGLQYGKAGA